jgi:hypothetical protein
MPHQNTNARPGTNSEDIVDCGVSLLDAPCPSQKTRDGQAVQKRPCERQLERPPFVGRAVARHLTGMKLLYCLNAPIVALDSSIPLILIAISGPRC